MTNELVVPQLDDSPAEIVSKPKNTAHLPALDGVRGIAILLVLFTHLSSILRSNPYLYSVLQVGWVGVDLFFVLSGFLITRILISTRQDERYYSRFYIRRGLRIWPLYFTYVLVIYAGLHFVSQIGAVQRFAETSVWLQENPLSLSRPLIFYLLFIQNLVDFHDMLGVTWSLCIEEHFYLIWPVLAKHFSMRSLRKVLWIGFLLSPVVRLAYFFLAEHSGTSYPKIFAMMYHSTPFHLDSIIAGCLLGLYWIEWPEPARFRMHFWVLLAVGAVTFGSLLPFLKTDSFVSCFAFTALSILFAGVVGLALLGWNHRVFVNPQLRYMGKISYGFYLIHEPIVSLFQSHPILHKIFHFHSVFLMELAGAICATGISLGLATLSWKLFEKPVLGLKDRLAP